MKHAGFVATEFWPKDLYEDPHGPDYACQLLHESGLRVSAYQALRDYEGMSSSTRGHVIGIAEQMMDQMAWVGADLLVLCTNVHPDSKGDRDQILRDLSRLAELARSRGIRIAYEAICWGRWISDYRDAWSIVKALNHENFGIMLDSLHIFCNDLPLDGIEEINPDKLFLVEVADIPMMSLSYLEIARHYRLFPGEGVAPIGAFLKRIEEIGYRGLYSVEIMNDHYFHSNPEEVAERAMQSMLHVLDTSVGIAGRSDTSVS
jgi:4-hydroxyphenylpyruvate dioxygenase